MGTEYCKVILKDLGEIPVPQYSEEEHGTWKLLIEKQMQLVNDHACIEFCGGLQKVQFPTERIPRLIDVSNTLQKHTGWSLLRVEGLVHPMDFFKLLAKKIFPSTDFIRKRSELMYTPAPDMFHDLFGHTPLLTSRDFTDFFENFGKVGAHAAILYQDPDNEINKMLQRIYWFTVEFGLIQTHKGLRAYGSGSCSSPEELEFCLSDKCRRLDFDIDVIAKKDFDIWHLQEEVFVIQSFKQLGSEFQNWARRMGLVPSQSSKAS
jgi:phenylalanine-4-hydroxylase